jgi:hypothetical protein
MIDGVRSIRLGQTTELQSMYEMIKPCRGKGREQQQRRVLDPSCLPACLSSAATVFPGRRDSVSQALVTSHLDFEGAAGSIHGDNARRPESPFCVCVMKCDMRNSLPCGFFPAYPRAPAYCDETTGFIY